MSVFGKHPYTCPPGRRFAAVLLTCVMFAAAVAICGCHGSRGLEPFIMPESFDTSKQHEIVFWAKNDTNRAQTKVYESAIAGFEAAYPNVKVSLRLYTDYGKIYNDVITNIATQTTPNVCITYPDHIATYLTGVNTVVPLDGLIADERYGLGGSEVNFDSVSADELVPQFIGECAIDGVTVALPYMRSTEACYINKTYVEALGYKLPETLTWDFIWEVSEAAMAKDADGNFKINGQKVLIPFIYKSTDNMMIQYLRQSGGGYSTPEGEILIFNDTALGLLKQVAKYTGIGAFSTFKISSYPANFLNAGQCIFAVDSTAGSTWMGCDAPLLDISEDALVRFETVVMPIPQYDTANPAMISQGPSVCVFNKSDPQEVLASWLFAQYLLTDDIQISYAKTEGYVPVTSRARETDEYKAYLADTSGDAEHYPVKLAATRLLLDNIGNTFTTPVFNGSASLRDASGQMIENTARAVRRKQTVDDAFYDNLYDDISSLYRLDQFSGMSKTEGKADLGPLPPTAAALLCALGGTWVLIGVYLLLEYVKTKRISSGGSS